MNNLREWDDGFVHLIEHPTGVLWNCYSSDKPWNDILEAVEHARAALQLNFNIENARIKIGNTIFEKHLE